MRIRSSFVLAVLAAFVCVEHAKADRAEDLRLVPFPKEIRLEEGRFSLDRPLTLEVPRSQAELIAQSISDELARAGLPALLRLADRVVFRGGHAPSIEVSLRPVLEIGARHGLRGKAGADHEMRAIDRARRKR